MKTHTRSNHVVVGAPNTPAEGDMWFDSGQNCEVLYVGGVKQYQPAILASTSSDGTISNTTTETNVLLGTGVGTFIVPANFLKVGKVLRLTAGGTYKTRGATPGNLQFKVYWGGLTGQLILDTFSQALVAGVADKLWWLEALISCRTTGTTGTLMSNGHVRLWDTITSSAGWNMANSLAQTVDTSVDKLLALGVTFNTADVDNVLRCHNAVLEALM